ncbi:LacI family DNA-binding transcriptional regulator [Curtobacterium sp. Leaf261]|uniref:LacI family DNA-binding transcriptional regulator n=1 Tax=Curtobacterium sp. Leaf261 TaxID=1736311 RepID=UPI0006FDA5D5|nr:LacI family DNA-binding transcriptional regulator [Curtobacterium sp. Leaf261]KQO62787.1 hypothetical protein ASF23_07530 [Curtobacterium sp. Leaf261]
MAGIQDLGLAAVAQLAGVSTATVSNTINRPEMVTARTRGKVEAAIRELDFVPNRAAAALRTGFSRLFGLVIPDVVNPFYASIVDAVSDAADRDGYSLALCVSHDDPAKELRQLDTLAQQRAAGALVVPLTADSSRLSTLRKVGSRLVLVDRVADPAESCSVAIDDRLGGALAAGHLLDAPGQGLTLVNGLRTIRQCEDRRNGTRDALSDRGLDPARLVEYETDSMTIESGVAIGHRLATEGAPRRVFCTNDQLAIGVIRGLAASGVATPTDAVVVGYGDLAFSTEGALPLTTVGQPKRLMGDTAVQRLLAELREGDAHRHVTTLLEPTLVVRESSSPH